MEEGSNRDSTTTQNRLRFESHNAERELPYSNLDSPGLTKTLENFEKQPMGEFVEIEIRPLLTKIDAKFSFSAVKLR